MCYSALCISGIDASCQDGLTSAGAKSRLHSGDSIDGESPYFWFLSWGECFGDFRVIVGVKTISGLRQMGIGPSTHSGDMHICRGAKKSV